MKRAAEIDFRSPFCTVGFSYTLESVVETESKVVAIEHQAAIIAVAGLFGCIVGAFISEHAHVSHKAEIVAEVDRDTGTETDIPGNGGLAVIILVVSPAGAETYGSIDRKSTRLNSSH